MRPILITGLAVASASGWAAIVAYIIPGGFVVKCVICFLGALAIGAVAALVLVKRWFKRLKTKEGGENNVS